MLFVVRYELINRIIVSSGIWSDMVIYLQYQVIIFMDARSAMRPCYILPMFFFLIFFMAALVGQTAERIFTKLSHLVDIMHHLRTY